MSDCCQKIFTVNKDQLLVTSQTYSYFFCPVYIQIPNFIYIFAIGKHWKDREHEQAPQLSQHVKKEERRKDENHALRSCGKHCRDSTGWEA